MRAKSQYAAVAAKNRGEGESSLNFCERSVNTPKARQKTAGKEKEQSPEASEEANPSSEESVSSTGESAAEKEKTGLSNGRRSEGRPSNRSREFIPVLFYYFICLGKDLLYIYII